jgi:D-alanyl-D-alanine dipeptidase
VTARLPFDGLGICAAALAALLFILFQPDSAAAQSKLPPGFVFLHDIDSSIAQDMRYAGDNNFVGHRLPGYKAAECILLRDAAKALKRVQEDLAASGYSLKVYDCYRPQRAVRAMLQWAYDGRSDHASERFYPNQEKKTLFAAGYIAARSAHSSGTTVDLTLIVKNGAKPAPFNPAAAYGPCNSPTAQRAPDDSIDMGTGFDCFDRMSFTRSTDITGEQRQRRALLLAAMNRRGFQNYFREWWHFGYGSVMPAGQYDFPIPRRTDRRSR